MLKTAPVKFHWQEKAKSVKKNKLLKRQQERAETEPTWDETRRKGGLTFCPGGRPGSQTARDSSLTSRSWTWPMLSPTFSRPSCSIPSVGTSTFRSRPRTFPKPRRNCISIRQSDTARPGRMSPGILENSGRGCGGETNLHRHFFFCVFFSSHLVPQLTVPTSKHSAHSCEGGCDFYFLRFLYFFCYFTVLASFFPLKINGVFSCIIKIL